MEAASVSRKIRLEELRKRKDASLSTGGVAGIRNGEKANGDGIINDLTTALQFDEEDEKMQEEGNHAELLRKRIESWSTAKLVHSFRILDRKQRVDYTKLKDSIENMIIGVQENAIADHEEKRKEELDLHNIAPKRPNWDLKRDLQKRLAKLDKRDREARLILIRQRIEQASKTNNGTQSSTDAVAAAAAGALGNSESVMAPNAESDSEVESEEGSE